MFHIALTRSIAALNVPLIRPSGGSEGSRETLARVSEERVGEAPGEGAVNPG